MGRPSRRLPPAAHTHRSGRKLVGLGQDKDGLVASGPDSWSPLPLSHKELPDASNLTVSYFFSSVWKSVEGRGYFKKVNSNDYFICI